MKHKTKFLYVLLLVILHVNTHAQDLADGKKI